MNRVYTPTHTLRQFHLSSAFARFIIGPYGSGKTHGLLYECLIRAMGQAPGPDGIRRSRMVVVRNTLAQLRMTFLSDWMQQFRQISYYKVSEQTIYVRFNDVELDIILLPLETTEDQRRLLSLQLTFAWLMEYRELDYEVCTALMGRLGRYPSATDGGPTWHGLFGDSNPFSRGTLWYENLVVSRPMGWDFFKQPSGLDDLAENRENLPSDYYERMIEGRSKEWVNVHVHGEFGDDLSGQAVFQKSFSPEWHTSPVTLEPHGNVPLVIGLDLGRTPCATLGQMRWNSQFAVLAELISENMSLEVFCKEKLLPLLHTERFANLRHVVVFDPSGAWKGQFTEHNAEAVLQSHGLLGKPAPTNDIPPRLHAIEYQLNQSLRGQPALWIDPSCVVLRAALSHHYRYRRKKTGEFEDTPDKNHPHSDVVDSLAYGIMGSQGNLVTRTLRRLDRRKNIQAKVPAVAAWT